MMRLFATGQMIAAYWSGPPQQAIGPISSAKVCMPMERLLILYDRCGSWFQIKIIFLHSEILPQRSQLVSSGGRCHSLFTGSFALSRRFLFVSMRSIVVLIYLVTIIQIDQLVQQSSLVCWICYSEWNFRSGLRRYNESFAICIQPVEIEKKMIVVSSLSHSSNIASSAREASRLSAGVFLIRRNLS